MRCNALLLAWALWGCVSLPALALARPPGSHPPHEKRLEQLVEALNLDPETLAKVTQIIAASKAEHRELRRKLWEASKHMRTLLGQENPDGTAVMAQAEVIGALKTESQKLRLRTMLQVRALLTPEQRMRLLEMLRAGRPCGAPGDLP